MFGNRTTTKNAVIFISGEAFWGFNSSLIASSTVLAVLLRELGASDRVIGSIGAIEAGLIVLPQILGMYFFSSLKNRKRNLIIWHLAAMIPFLFISGGLIVFKDSFSASFLKWALLLSYACFMGSIGIIAGVWMDWLAHLFEEKIRGTLMGLAFFASALLGTIGGLAAGLIIKAVEGHAAYAILYLAAGVFASLSILTFFFVDDPVDRQESAQSRRITPGDILYSFRESLKDANFKSFLVCRILASLGFCIIPFIAIFFKSAEGGSLSNSAIVTCGAAMTLGAAISNLLLGRFGDKHGHRIGIVVGTAMQVITLAILLAGSGQAYCAAVYFCTGICASSAFISHTNMLLESCPHEFRIAHLTVGNLIMSIPLISAPFLAGLCAESFGLRTVFVICLILSAASFIWGLFLVKEPRYLRVIDVHPRK
ncbi:MAG: MFS transporter [Victivallales bacterium]